MYENIFCITAGHSFSTDDTYCRDVKIIGQRKASQNRAVAREPRKPPPRCGPRRASELVHQRSPLSATTTDIPDWIQNVNRVLELGSLAVEAHTRGILQSQHFGKYLRIAQLVHCGCTNHVITQTSIHLGSSHPPVLAV